MTVNNHNEQGKDCRAQPRWSAGKKTDAVRWTSPGGAPARPCGAEHGHVMGGALVQSQPTNIWPPLWSGCVIPQIG
jgi:hypothetical protein